MKQGQGTATPEDSLSTRAAWLHYVGGLTQSAVAKRLGVTSVKAHRLIAKAVSEGALKVSIDGDVVECIELEAQLAEKYGLSTCEVAPEVEDDDLPLRALGAAGANYLSRLFELGQHEVIGVAHGRTLASAVMNLPRRQIKQIRFVSLLGQLTRNFSVNPHDVMHLLAQRTGAQAYIMPVPFFANTRKDRRVLLAQRGVQEIFEMAQSSPLKLVGIGSVKSDAQLVISGMIEQEEIAEIDAAGGVGEMVGHFFDSHGKVLKTPLTERALSVDLKSGKDEGLVALAGGTRKVDAIRAVLRSGHLSGLITDERTARALLD